MISKFHSWKIFCFLCIFLNTDIILFHDYFDLNVDGYSNSSLVINDIIMTSPIINVLVKFTILLRSLLFMDFSIALWLLWGEKLLKFGFCQ